MKKLMIVAVAMCAALASCQGSKSLKSYSDVDSLSYAFGVDIGSSLKRMDTTQLNSSLNDAIITAAIRDMFNNKPQISHEDAVAFLNEWFQVRMPAKQKAEGQEWLDKEKASNPNIQTTESGLMYEIINTGDMAVKAVIDADQVVAKYRGTLKDGTEFDKNDSLTLSLNRVIRGWTEGMKLVGKGGEIVLWIPADLGYGAQARPNIPANSPLKFEITLLDVIPASAE